MALRQIAVEFQHRHHDDWLRDVLQLHRSPAAKLSFLAVAKAAQALDAEDSATAEAQAIAAIKLFRSEGTMPGLLLAQLQHVAALQLQSRYAECAKASEPLTQSLQHYNYPWLHTLALLEQGTCQTWAHEFDQGGRQYNEALALAETSSYPVLRLRTFGLRANRQQVFVGSTADAWKNGAKGLSQYWDGLYPPSRVRDLYSVYASLAESMNLKQAGIQWTKELTYIALLLQRKDLYAICMYLLATAENAADLYPDAVRHLNEASSLINELRSSEDRILFHGRIELATAEAEANMGKKREALNRLLVLRPSVPAFDPLLRVTFWTQVGMLWFRLGKYAEATRVLTTALDLAKASATREVESERVVWAHGLEQLYSALVQCDLKSRGQRESLERWNRYQAGLFDAPESIINDHPAVQPDEALLSLVRLPTGFVAWLSTATGSQFHSISERPEFITAKVANLLENCSNEQSSLSAIRASGRALSQAFLGPWEKDLTAVHSLTIQTDAALSSVPWPALVLSNGRYWQEAFSIRSRAIALRLPLKERISPLSKALVVGITSLGGDDDLPPLPEAGDEAKKVSAYFRRSTLLMGQTATLKAMRASLKTSQMFHFAGHGYNGDGGGLWVSNGAGSATCLRAADIRSMSLAHCGLAVLSACSSAAGELNGPSDPNSLVRAFLHAGVQEVVASLWNINSGSTTQMMTILYQQLLSDHSTAESLRIAATFTRTRRFYTHPYYWAGFQVFTTN